MIIYLVLLNAFHWCAALLPRLLLLKNSNSLEKYIFYDFTFLFEYVKPFIIYVSNVIIFFFKHTKFKVIIRILVMVFFTFFIIFILLKDLHLTRYKIQLKSVAVFTFGIHECLLYLTCCIHTVVLFVYVSLCIKHTYLYVCM